MLKEFIPTCLDLLYPRNCHLCSKILKEDTKTFDRHICWDCFLTMRQSLPIPDPSDDKHAPFYEKLLTCYLYEGAAKELIHKFKYNNRPYLSKTIAKLITNTLNPAHLDTIDLLVPVPLHPARAREREFNQSELLARDLACHFHKPFFKAVKKIKNTASQISLKKQERSSNLVNAFTVDNSVSLKRKHILVIDDVVTTTATVNEVSRSLKNAGAKSVSVLSFARG